MDKQQGDEFVAKAPETQDRFRIFAETSSEAMGPLLAQLTRMGLENIGYELITDVASFQTRTNKSYDISADELTEKWIADNPTFQVKALVHHFKDNGRPGTSAYPAVRNLIDSGKLVKLSPGHYQRSDVKAIAAPQKTEGKRPANPVARYETPNLQLIISAIKNRKRFMVKEMESLLTEHGRNPKSASPLMNKLKTNKIIKLIEPGSYAVNKDAAAKAAKGEKPKSKKPTTATEAQRLQRNLADRARRAAQRLNGANPAPSPEETHG